MMDHSEDQTQASHFEIEQELRRMNEEWVAALVNRDAETLARIMADDFIFNYPMEGDDKEQFILDVASGDVQVPILERENLSVRIYGSTAVLTGRDKAHWIYKGRHIEGHYRTIEIYAERDGRWQLVTVQACPITH
jgi:ketosteroid isomerase-like protein